MTAIFTSVSEKHVNDITECPICNEIFTDPRVLPCIHTFCLECLVKWSEDKDINGKLACPLCAKELKVGSGAGRIADLPKNFFVQKLLDARKISSALSAAEILCDICSDRDADSNTLASVHEAIVYCTECGQNICEQCHQCHQRLKTTSGHKTVELQNHSPDGELLIDLPENMCGKHPDEIQRLFCFDCKLPTCTVCFASYHKSHNCTDVKVAADEMRRQVEGDMKNIVNKADEYRQMLSQQLENETQSEFSRKIEETAKVVIETAEKMKETIDVYKVKLLKELEMAKMQHEKKLESVRQELETSLMMLDIFKQYLQQLSSKGTPCDIATAASSLHKRAQELIQHKVSVTGVTNGLMNVKFTSEFSSDNVQSIFGQLCIENNDTFTDTHHVSVVSVIPGRFGQNCVSGVTALGDEVFVVCHLAKNIEVYDAESLKLKRLITTGRYKSHESSLAACDRNKCIYMSICIPGRICRIVLTGNEMKTWKLEGARTRGISTNSDTHLLVACCEENRVQEYTTDGILVREFVLHTGGTSSLFIMDVIQLPGDHFGVTYQGSLHGFAVVDSHGHAIRSYAGQTRCGPIYMPKGLALDECQGVFIATDGGIFVLNLQTFHVSQLGVLPQNEHRLRLPYCICYDRSRHRLYIGEHGAKCRVVAVDIEC